jgi:hypothetical protein
VQPLIARDLRGRGVALGANGFGAGFQFVGFHGAVELAQKLCVAIQNQSDIAVVGSEHRFEDGERSLVERLRVRKSFFGFV